MSYSIVEGVANNDEVIYCPFCGTYENMENKSQGKNKCKECNKVFYVIEDEE